MGQESATRGGIPIVGTPEMRVARTRVQGGLAKFWLVCGEKTHETEWVGTESGVVDAILGAVCSFGISVPSIHLTFSVQWVDTQHVATVCGQDGADTIQAIGRDPDRLIATMHATVAVVNFLAERRALPPTGETL